MGSRLVAIEGKDLSEVLEAYDKRYANETYSWLKGCFENYNDMGFGKADFRYLNIMEDDKKDTACFSLEQNGKVNEVEVKSIVEEEEQLPEFVSIYDDMKELPFNEKVYEESGQAPFTYLLDEENEAFYFQYNECADSITQGEDSGYPEFKSFFAEMIQEMKEAEG